ncbi:MAG: S9 family peptidase [Bacteroidota bacterium]|nr:S9 family peptidase [Bacteroidota bacterium]
MKRGLFLGVLFTIVLFVNAQQIFTPELLWKLGRVSDVRISPDNRFILFGVTHYDVQENKGNRDIYIESIDGSKPLQVTNFPGNELNARWRPDGLRIGFLSDKSGSMQLWEVNPDGTSPEQVSNIDGGVTGFEYSPTMDHIYFTKDVKLDKTVSELYPDLPKANARIIDDLMYRHWDAWSDYTYSHILISKLNDWKPDIPMDIMKDERYDSPLKPDGGNEEISWSPNGILLAYTCKKQFGKEYAISTNSDIYVYNADTKKTENISEGNLGYDKDPVFSPDSKKIAWISMKTPGYESDKLRIIIYDFATKKKEDLTANFDQSSSNLVWSEDGKKLYFISGINATFQIYSYDFVTKKINQVTRGTHDYTSLALAGNMLVGEKMNMSMPTEIFKINPVSGEEVQLTNTNKEILSKTTMAKVEERHIRTFDGKDMLTWVIYPPNFDPLKKYPALLYCQGGPQSAVSQFFSYRWNFQMMAANGYIIVAPNRRGLPTFGQEWNDEIAGDYGGKNMKDYLSAIDSISSLPFVDKSKLGAVGASYGAFSIYWLAGNHNKRFKAFIAHCGMFDFESWYGTTEEMFFANHDIGGPYWLKDKPKSYSFSPHRFVGNWDTPILVIHGGNDFRIPYTQGMEAFDAAQLRGIPSRFLFFPEETHFVSKPQNSILWQRVFKEWLDKYLK